jgi:hypothetical protein
MTAPPHAAIAAIAATTSTNSSILHTILNFVVLPVVVAGFTAIVTLLVTKAGEATARRRDRYADAVKTLVSWTELPYRVRRRTDDNPATLAALAERGHDLQEHLACYEAWIAADHPRLARSYANARATITAAVAPAVTEAWTCAPITSASEMNLGTWGPGATCRAAIVELQTDIGSRFGLRRLRRRTTAAQEVDSTTKSATSLYERPADNQVPVGGQAAI